MSVTVRKGKYAFRLPDLLKMLLLLGVAVLLLFLAFRGIRFQTIVAEIRKADWSWIFLSFLASAIALVSRAYRWNLLLHPLGYRPPLRKTFYALSIGYFANLAFPRLGEVTRCGSLSKTTAVPFHVLLGTVIAERIIDVISLLVCIAITAWLEFDRLGNFLIDSIVQPLADKWDALWQSPLALAALVLVMLALVIFIWYRKTKKNTTENREGKIALLLKGIIAGMASVRRLEKPWLFVFHSIFIWALYYASVYLAFFALPSTSGLGAGAGLFLLVAGGLAMSAPVQGGIGAYHLLVSQGLILYGISRQDGLAFATLLHSLQLLLIVVFGCISLVLSFVEKQDAEHPDAVLKEKATINAEA